METPDMVEVPTGEEVSEDNAETSSPESPPVDENEFNNRVERLMGMMENDSKVRDRLIAETYVNIASAEMGIRGMFEMMQSQGVAGLMKGAFRRGG
jgi:hypothetical protein